MSNKEEEKRDFRGRNKRLLTDGAAGAALVYLQPEYLLTNRTQHLRFAAVAFPAEDRVEGAEAEGLTRVVAEELVHVQAEVAVDHELDERYAMDGNSGDAIKDS